VVGFDSLLQSVQYVVDESGMRKSVLLDYNVWEDILTVLEDLDDAQELEHAKLEHDDTLTMKDVLARYTAAHPDAEL
jgi:hypothetical protein